MELNITQFFREACARDYSASIAEVGRDAGADTWRAACDDSAEYPLLDTDDKRQAFRDYIKGFGAWDDAEIAAMSDLHLNALCIQMIAGDIREAELEDKSDAAWLAYESQDAIGGNLYRANDSVYYYIGS